MAKTKLYDSASTEPFRISRSKIENFIRCPRCFVLNVKHGLKDIASPPFTINTAVDAALKSEFDGYRETQTVPPVIEAAGLNLVPFKHENMDVWRSNFKGVQFDTDDFQVFGAVDDIWVNEAGELIVADYKATSRKEAVTELGEGGFYDSYRRQMEVYQWLLRKNGFKVSNTGYWLYVTATKDQETFNGTLHFEQNLIAYEGDDSWIESTLDEIKQTLDENWLPESGHDCDTCRYVKQRNQMLLTYPEQDEQPEICATCHNPMRKAIYGMPAGDPGPGYVVMGCIMNGDGSDPQWVCEHCRDDESLG